MLKVLFVIGIVAALAVLAVVVLALRKPDSFRIERSIVVNAPADSVFPLVNDFHHWGAWSPWEKLDPQMVKTHSGAQDGKGAVYTWKGNGKAGEGRMEITESVPLSKLSIKLNFIKPFKAENFTEFTFIPTNAGETKVTWSMTGPTLFPTKVMMVLMDFDAFLGKDFDSGLKNLKTLVEKH